MSNSKSFSFKINSTTGLALVVANMIGTGAFTSLGFQLNDISNHYVILVLWILGGILALAGALSYAEVSLAVHKSGGEYSYLSALYSPMIGYLSGWISITVGFVAPIALSAMAAVKYFPFCHLSQLWSSIFLIGIITLIHTFTLKISSVFQNVFTLLKTVLIIAIILVGLIQPSHSVDNFQNLNFVSDLTSLAFGVALIFVSYSYSGYNASVYILTEFRNPKKSIPIALISGTLIVTVLYTLLQFVFLKHANVSDLAGQIDVGHIVATNLFGKNIGNLFSVSISLLLVSSISAMVWVGSRVTSSIAIDYPLWNIFKTNQNGIPVYALILQFCLSVLFLVSGSFEQILVYCGIQLILSSSLTVFAVFLLRRKKAHIDSIGFKSPLYPFFQILFLIFSLAMIIFTIFQNPMESLFGLSNLILGYITWLFNKKLINKSSKNEI